MRDFLFYVSCAKGKCEAELFGENRLFDVAVNDFTETNLAPEQAEYRYSVDKWKYRHLKEDMLDLIKSYKAIAIFDEDVLISTDSINKLFTLGNSLNFNIWQAALTKDSYSSWVHLYQKPNSNYRLTNTIEIMMPFFSKSALEICLESFDINYSAWGAQAVWHHLLKGEKIMVVDSIPVKHTRPIQGHSKVMPNGLSPYLEGEMMFDYYKIRPPKDVF